MTFEKLFRFGGMAAILSGAADIIGIFILITAVYVPAIPGIASGIFFMAAGVLVAFALMGIYGCQVEKTGSLALTGFVVTITGLLLVLAGFFNPLGWVLHGTGILILAIAHPGKVFPAEGLWIWFLGIIIAVGTGIAGFRIVSWIGTLITAAARIWIGASLQKN